MKLATVTKTVRAKTPVKAHDDLTQITKRNVDNELMYVGQRVPTRSIVLKTIGLAIPALPKHGYLLVHGDKPGILLHEVQWDGKGVYARETEKGSTKYGSLQAMNGTEHKHFAAEILTEEELFARARKFDKVLEIERASDGKKFAVAMLFEFGKPYAPAIGFDAQKHLFILNTEPLRPYNARYPNVRFHNAKPIKSKAAAFIAAHSK